MFNKTVRVLFSAVRLPPLLQVLLTLSLYCVMDHHNGQVQIDSSELSGTPNMDQDPATPGGALRWVLRVAVLPVLPAVPHV
mmetsp:Transcript_37113/g.91731  ORF Transcript_37113/g.91731 Transcript_37113/m.91731 type:complete len:81 (+) Transcript_37113:168-410(+)